MFEVHIITKNNLRRLLFFITSLGVVVCMFAEAEGVRLKGKLDFWEAPARGSAHGSVGATFADHICYIC